MKESTSILKYNKVKIINAFLVIYIFVFIYIIYIHTCVCVSVSVSVSASVSVCVCVCVCVCNTKIINNDQIQDQHCKRVLNTTVEQIIHITGSNI